MTARRIVGLRVLVAALLVVLLAGCVSLPDSSSVKTGRGAGVHQGLGQVKSSPPGPKAGALPQDIVAGYLRAMLAFPSDPAVVRQFMSPPAARAWQPDQGIQVYEDPTIALVNGAVHLTARLLGSLDVRGSWSSTIGQEATMDMRMSMVRVDGQWRIANPLAGTLIDTDNFSRYYHQYSLYFFDPTYTVLAPDPVYLQIGTAGTTATALVRDLLLGPTSDMTGVVRSAAPTTPTRLTPRVTVTSSGSAVVPLSSNVGALQAGRLRWLFAQLAWTLRQERVGVNHLRVEVDGRTLTVPRLPPEFSVDSFPHYDPALSTASRTLYALSESGRLFGVTARNTTVRVTGPISTAGIQARSVAVNPPASSAALVSDDGTVIVAGDLGTTPAETSAKTWHRNGTNLLRPSWDASGLLWLVDLRDHRATVEVATKSLFQVVDAPGIAGHNVRAFAVSRDGMRFAAVLGHGDQSQLVIAMIKRSVDPKRLTPVSLVGIRDITNSDFPLSNIRGLAWVNPTTIVVLAQDSSSEAQPYEVAVDGSHVQPTSGFLPIGPVSVASGPGIGAPTVIGSKKGQLYVQTSPDQWTPLTTSPRLTAPVYPG